MRDENNRLKGEQGKPNIKPNKHGKQPGQSSEHSSEAERRKPQAWHKSRKLEQIQIDREEVLTVDPTRNCPPMRSSRAMKTPWCRTW